MYTRGKLLLFRIIYRGTIAFIATYSIVTIVYAQQASNSSDTQSDHQCVPEDATHKYLGPDPRYKPALVTNLSKRICSQTTGGITVVGTCDAPEKCHAHYCQNNSTGSKVVCPLIYLDPTSLMEAGAPPALINNLSNVATPDQKMDQLMLNPTPLAQQNVTLQPVPTGNADMASYINMPPGSYLDGYKSSTPLDQLNAGFLIDSPPQGPTPSEKAIDNALSNTLQSNSPTPVSSEPYTLANPADPNSPAIPYDQQKAVQASLNNYPSSGPSFSNTVSQLPESPNIDDRRPVNPYVAVLNSPAGYNAPSTFPSDTSGPGLPSGTSGTGNVVPTTNSQTVPAPEQGPNQAPVQPNQASTANTSFPQFVVGYVANAVGGAVNNVRQFIFGH